MQLGNALNWFEIPVTDFERGKKFYETIFNYQMPENMMGNVRMGFFLYDFQNGKVGGAICKSEMHKPSHEGSLVYLNCQPDLQVELSHSARVHSARRSHRRSTNHDRISAPIAKIVSPGMRIQTSR